VPNLAFGYEEAIGYCCDPAYVADKDGITATVEVLRLVGELKAEGQTLADRLAELNRLYGVHATSQLAIRVDDLNLIQQGMTRLRAMPPTRLAGEPVRARDLLVDTRGLPPTDAVELSGPTVRVVARPSGTEPKLKCYLEARRPQPEANRTLDLLAEQMHQALGL
jgi:phosphomannomutase